MKKGDILTWERKLGKIWAKLNHGIKPENLSMLEKEILYTEYGENWVLRIAAMIGDGNVKIKWDGEPGR